MSRSITARGALVLLAAGALFGAGCGKDSSSSSSTKSTLAMSALVSQVDAVCTSVRSDSDAAISASDDEVKAVKQLKTISVDGTNELRDLVDQAPSGAKKVALAKMVAILDKANPTLVKAVKIGDAEDPAFAAQLEAYQSRLAELRAVAKPAGFAACAKEPPSTSTTETTEVTDTTADGSSSGLEHIDLNGNITAPDGYELSSVDSGVVTQLIDGFNSEPAVAEVIDKVGTAQVAQGGTPKGLIMLLHIKVTLDDAKRSDLLSGVANGKTPQDVTVAGNPGVKTIDTDGTVTVATVKGDTLALVVGDSETDVDAIIAGLFSANPDL